MVHNAVSTHVSHKLSMKSFKQALGQTDPSRHFAAAVPVETDTALRFGRKLPSLKAAADQLVLEALRRSSENQTIAASLLNITQPSRLAAMV